MSIRIQVIFCRIMSDCCSSDLWRIIISTQYYNILNCEVPIQIRRLNVKKNVHTGEMFDTLCLIPLETGCFVFPEKQHMVLFPQGFLRGLLVTGISIFTRPIINKNFYVYDIIFITSQKCTSFLSYIFILL